VPDISTQVHGTAAQVQFPATDLTGQPSPINAVAYTGSGVVVQGYNNLVWVHFPIPVPKQADGIVVSKVFVFYKTPLETKVQNIHAYDGLNRFLALDDLNLTGDFRQNLTASNSWDTNHLISHSLGISVGVSFSVNLDTQPQPFQDPITINAAGAEFYTFVRSVTLFPGGIVKP
jgi:hypothetical protein